MKYVLDTNAYAPTKAYGGDAGWDLRTPSELYVEAHSHVIVDTGVHVAIPYGCVGFIKSKSGLNIKQGITSEGVIDSGYTGSIRVRLDNYNDEPAIFLRGDKITQLVILPVILEDMELATSLLPTERGDNGFGSSGK